MEDTRKKDGILGFDDDGWLMGIFFILVIIAIIVTIIIYAIVFLLGIGALIGGFFAIKNYVESFKENVIDSNRNAKIA